MSKKFELLLDRVESELNTYERWLKSQTTEEALKHAYEYVVKHDIMIALEELEDTISDELVQALFDQPGPLNLIFENFIDKETDYMETLRLCVEDEAKHLIHG